MPALTTSTTTPSPPLFSNSPPGFNQAAAAAVAIAGDIITINNNSNNTNTYNYSNNNSIINFTTSTGTSDGSGYNLTGGGAGADDDDYYDYDVSDYSVPLAELVPVTVVYGATLVLGLGGNLLVIVVVASYRAMNNITNTFLLSLASADLLLVVICIPVKFAAFFTFSWTLGEFLCKAVSYLQNVSALCSVFTLTAMSLERYYAILHPMRAKYVCTVGRARRAILLLWLASAVLALPIIFQRIHKEVGLRHRAYWCVKNWEDTVSSQLYEVYMLWLMLVLPLSIISFAYVSICKELWAVTSLRSTMATRGQNPNSDHHGSFHDASVPGFQGNVNGAVPASGKGGKARFTFRSSQQTPPSSQSSSPYRAPTERSPVIRIVRKNKISSEDERTRKQVIKMLVAVIAIFVVCWTPILLSNVLTAFRVLHQLNYGYLKPMRQAFYLLAYVNSCVNPLIYGFMSRHFRRTFVHAICTCVKGRDYTRTKFMQRHNSCVTRSSHLGYNNSYYASKAGSDLELTVMDVSCGNCVTANAM